MFKGLALKVERSRSGAWSVEILGNIDRCVTGRASQTSAREPARSEADSAQTGLLERQPASADSPQNGQMAAWLVAPKAPHS